jgi:hypothetical protein
VSVWLPLASDLPRGLGVHGALRPAHELHALGGRDGWLFPAHALEEYDH